MILAEFDLGQIIIIVIAMVAGFVHWLWNAIKQGYEESRRQQQTPAEDAEQKRLREEAWKKQTQGGRPAPTAAPPTAHDPWSTVRDVFEKMQEETRKAQMPRPPSPPPLPQRPPPPPPAPPARVLRHSVRAELHPPPPPPPAEPFPTAPLVRFPSPAPAPAPSPAGALASAPRSQDLGFLMNFLRHPGSMRQAVLLREILGPPKALQSSGEGSF